MYGEENRAAPITIVQGHELLTGSKAAISYSCEKISNITAPQERINQVKEKRKTSNEHQPTEHMNKPFNMKELEDAIKASQEKKSPGPDKVTNEMLLHLGTKVTRQLLKIDNNSWKTGLVPQI